MIELLKGDCLEVMKSIESGSVDAIICDPPYQITACKWDKLIPFDLMWEQLNRIIKPNGAIVLFGSEPFSSALRMSNIKNYKYDWVWNKDRAANFATIKYSPAKVHENIIIFAKGKTTYNPIRIPRNKESLKRMPAGTVYSESKKKQYQKKECADYIKIKPTGYSISKDGLKNPISIINVNGVHGRSKEKQEGRHPTQKPVKLMEYLIKTYTNKNELVLDFTMGSGTTGVGCVNLNRQFIGIEQDENYYNIAVKRIEDAKKELNKLTLFK